jgi:hypothetical protein
VDWFSEEFVVPNDADILFRARRRDRIDQAWPRSGATPTADPLNGQTAAILDSNEARSWLDLVALYRSSNRPGDVESKMLFLLGQARLNESFAQLFDQELLQATEAFELASSILIELGSDHQSGKKDTNGSWRVSPGPEVKPGQPIGPDGVWSIAFREALRASDLRQEMLSKLASTAGTDLGPLDAETFVRAVYQGVPQEVRTQAQSVLLRRFSTGPVVLQQVLDQLPDVRPNANLAEFISSLTGTVLPVPGSASWKSTARVAILEHLLQLHRGGKGVADVLTSELIDTYVNRIVALESGAERLTWPQSPGEAAQWLVETRLRRSGHMMTSSPVPDDLPGLHRQRTARLEMAEGPIQIFVAEQITALDLLAYETAAQFPSLQASIVDILNRSGVDRSNATHVLDQSIETERAMLELNALNLTHQTRPIRGRGGS